MQAFNKEAKALCCGLAAVLLWSTVATAFKIGLQYAEVLWLLTGSCIFSLLVLAVALVQQQQLKQALVSLLGSWRIALPCGLLNPAIYYLVLFEAYNRLPAQIAQPVNYTWGITLALLAVIFLGKKITRFDIIGMLLAYSGVFIISIAGENITQDLDYWGLILALVSTLIWAAYWLLGMKDRRPPIIALFQNFCFATPILIGLVVIEQNQVDAKPLVWSLELTAAMVYIGFFEMGFSFILWQYALKNSQYTARISSLIFLSPFISLFIIHHVLGEPLQWLTFVGLGVIIAGISVQQYTSIGGRALNNTKT